MSKPRISEKEKIVLRNTAKDELLRMEMVLTDHATIQTLDSFKNKYNTCETVYKVILAEHQKNKNRNADKKILKVDMRQVPYVLEFAGYSFNKELLSKLFGSDETSAKKLRDAVTHGIDEKAASEIVRIYGYIPVRN